MHPSVKGAARPAACAFRTFLAHYAGDESFSGTEMLATAGLSLMGRLVVGSGKNLVESLFRYPETADNEVVLRLDTGAWTRETREDTRGEERL